MGTPTHFQRPRALLDTDRRRRGARSSLSSGGITPARRFAYQPALDGLRALAVGAVLAYHAGLPWARGGFLGVDAFFVLSGYLITSLLLREWAEHGRIDLRDFWLRRARRLLPALFLVIAWVVVYAALFAPAAETTGVRADAIATLAYVANWKPIFAGQSYFAQFSAPSPLLHTWSLAVEEQWYLVWPLIVIVVLRLTGGSLRALIGVSAVLALASATLMAVLYHPHADPSRIYYGTDTRAQSLLIGAVLAAALAGPLAIGRRVLLLECAAVACICFVGWMWVATRDDSAFLYRGGFLLLALAVATIIAAAVMPAGGAVRRVCSLPPLAAIGARSYGIYLWHWPVYVALTPDRLGVGGYDLLAVRLAVTALLTVASYELVENPIRRGTLRFGRPAWALAPACVAILVAALFVVVPRGSSLSATASTPPPPAAAGGRIARTRVLVVGDSVAFTMAQGLARAAPSAGLSVWNQGKLGCGILRGERVLVNGTWTDPVAGCNDWPARWQSDVDLFQPDVVVVLAGAWDLNDREVDGRVLRFGTAEADAYAESEVDLAISVLASKGARVVLLTTPHYAHESLGLSSDTPRFDATRIDHLNALYQREAQQHPGGVEVADLETFAGGQQGGMASMTSDGVHFTAAGADAVARWLAPIVRDAAAPHAAQPTAAAGNVASAPAPDWLGLLRRTPDTPSTRAFTAMNDYARFRALFGVRLPDSTDGDAILAYARSLLFDENGEATALVPASSTGLSDASTATGDGAERSFNAAEIDQDVAGGDAALQLLHGRFAQPPARAAGSTGTESALADGEDLVNCTQPCDIASVAHIDPGASLADFPDFVTLAERLTALGTYTAAFSDDTSDFTTAAMAHRVLPADAGDAALRAAAGRLSSEQLLLPYEAFALGAAVDKTGPYTALVIVNRDEATAAANVERLRGRIATGSSWLAAQAYRDLIPSAEITSEGKLVIAKLRATSRALWYGVVAAHDGLMLHE